MRARSMHQVLKEVFGFSEFRGHQAAAIEHILAGGDCLVLMPTGGGKSICYQVPALMVPGTGVVISPLIALMQDQVSALRQMGVRAAFLNSSLTPEESRKVESALCAGDLDLLYVAPERLLQERTLSLLDRSTLALFAIDEAHCVSRWGHDFRPDYLQLDLLGRRYPAVPRLACTATADERTRAEILQGLGLERARLFVSGFDRPNIQYRIGAKDNPTQQLIRFIRREHPGDAGIVYCMTRKRVEQVAAALQQKGFRALPYHAGMEPEDRQRHQERFLREDGIIIVATIAFGMGIDKPDVRFVAHLDLPKSIEAYYQETGRAGRDGAPATAWMVYGLQDVVLLRRLVDAGAGDEMHKRVERQRLDALLGFCEVDTCRRQVLLRYFGDTMERPCGNCDRCLHPVATFDGTVAAQKVLSCAVRTGQRFGAMHLVEVLRGVETDRIVRLRHDQLPTFGAGTEYDAATWRSIIRQLVARGLMTADPEGYGGLCLTDRARGVLQGRERVELREELREELRRPAALPTRGRKAAGAAAGRLATEEPAAVEVDQGLFEQLRELRKNVASRQRVPPFIIFHDRTLREMAARLPTTEEELSAIPGVGDAKLRRYGKTFLALVKAHVHPER